MNLEREKDSKSHWHVREMTRWPKQGGETEERFISEQSPRAFPHLERRRELKRQGKKIVQLEALQKP